MFNKRGMELDTSTLISIILIFIFLVIVLGGGYLGLFDISEGFVKEKNCRMSVTLSHTENRISSLVEKKFETECPTHRVKIDANDDILKIIANEMASCWYKFGEGQMNPFLNRFTSIEKDGFEYYKGLVTDRSINVCGLCAIIEFDDELVRKFNTGELETLTKFRMSSLNTHLATTTVPGEKISYTQYITGSAKSTDELEKENRTLDNENLYYITPDQKLAIVFGVTKHKKTLTESVQDAATSWKSIAPGIGAATPIISTPIKLISKLVGKSPSGFVIGAVVYVGFAALQVKEDQIQYTGEYTPYMQIIPYQEDDLRNICTVFGEQPLKAE